MGLGFRLSTALFLDSGKGPWIVLGGWSTQALKALQIPPLTLFERNCHGGRLVPSSARRNIASK